MTTAMVAQGNADRGAEVRMFPDYWGDDVRTDRRAIHGPRPPIRLGAELI